MPTSVVINAAIKITHWLTCLETVNLQNRWHDDLDCVL